MNGMGVEGDYHAVNSYPKFVEFIWMLFQLHPCRAQPSDVLASECARLFDSVYKLEKGWTAQ